MFMSFNTVDFIAFFTFSVTAVFNVTTELTKLIEYIHTYIHLFELDRKIQNIIRQTDGQTNIEKIKHREMQKQKLHKC